MINKKNIAQALVLQANTIASLNTYIFITQGEQYEQNINDTYIEEMPLFGDDNSIGISDNSSDIQFGIYQLNIYTPKSNDGGRWEGLEIADVYQAGFAKGLEIEQGGQVVRIKSTSLAVMQQTKDHFKHILSVAYSVIG